MADPSIEALQHRAAGRSIAVRLGNMSCSVLCEPDEAYEILADRLRPHHTEGPQRLRLSLTHLDTPSHRAGFLVLTDTGQPLYVGSDVHQACDAILSGCSEVLDLQADQTGVFFRGWPLVRNDTVALVQSEFRFDLPGVIEALASDGWTQLPRLFCEVRGEDAFVHDGPGRFVPASSSVPTTKPRARKLLGVFHVFGNLTLPQPQTLAERSWFLSMLSNLGWEPRRQSLDEAVLASAHLARSTPIVPCRDYRASSLLNALNGTLATTRLS